MPDFGRPQFPRSPVSPDFGRPQFPRSPMSGISTGAELCRTIDIATIPRNLHRSCLAGACGTEERLVANPPFCTTTVPIPTLSTITVPIKPHAMSLMRREDAGCDPRGHRRPGCERLTNVELRRPSPAWSTGLTIVELQRRSSA
eukprot:354784-Chlamydomonas_euryale.AAC.2